MAFRFGRSHWQDSDRLNLMTVCQEHQQWEKRLDSMRKIYSKVNYPPGYFTENSCREELERLMSLPTPNLRLDTDKHFVYSRKIMMEKWVEHLTAEVKKQQKTQAELAMVTVRKNTEYIKEALSGTISEERIQELLQTAKDVADKKKNDQVYKRIVGSLDAAITDRLTKSGGKLDIGTLVLPPTKPPGEDAVTGSRGFLTPTHSMNAPDFQFSPMLSLSEAVRDAAPVPPPPEPVEPEPIPSVSDFPIPDEIMEPPASPVVVKVKEKEPEKIASPQKTPAKPTRNASSRGAQKKNYQSPLEVKTENEIKEEEEEPSTPTHIDETLSSETPNSHGPTPRGRGRPRTVRSFPRRDKRKNEGKADEELLQNSSVEPPEKGEEKPEKKKTVEKVENKKGKGKKENSPTPSTESTPTASRRRPIESSQESSSFRAKKPRNPPIVPPSSMCTRRKKGGEVENEDASSSRTSSVQPVPRSEGSVDGGGGAATNRGTPEEPHHREIEVQTNITIRQMVQEVSMGERRRSNAPPAFRKGRKSQLPAAEHPGRSVSRNSSASTPGPRASSTGPRASSNGPPSFRNAFVQTNVRFDLEKDDLVVMRVDVNTQQYHRAEDLEFSDQIVINEETCKEIAAENADAGENTVEMGKRASKVDGRREMTMIVESEDCITQRLVEENGYQVVSQTSDLPSAGANDSPVKRSRREDRARDEVTSTRYQLNTMFRALYDCEWSEAFKKPVPPGEIAYDRGVLQRIDLSMIKKEIENGTISSVAGFLLRVYRMLSNALMYNGWDHEVHIHAKAIFEQVMVDITSSIQDDRRSGASNTPIPRRSRPIDGGERPTSRAGSMEPEPMTPIGSVGLKRKVFRKDPNVNSPMSTDGSRKSKTNKR